MRHSFFVFLFIALTCSLYGQQQMHTVGKGETLETIVKKYGVTLDDLKKVNPRLNKVYYGMKIAIPGKKNQSTIELSQNNVPEESITRSALAYIGFAEDYIKEGKHKKAIKELDKSLEIQETVKARWLRGKCYFYEEKWKKALDDLDFVRNHQLTDHTTRSNAETMYNNAYNSYELKRAERTELWTQIGAGVVLAAAVVGTAAIAGKSSSSSGTSTGGATGSSGDYDTGDSSSSGGYASSQSGYQQIYDTHANTAESLFNTLTQKNTRINDHGTQKGIRRDATNAHNSASYSTLKPKLQKVQAEMTKIRKEAESKGFSIRTSEYESATVY